MTKIYAKTLDRLPYSVDRLCCDFELEKEVVG
ncbi:hypothetical protein TSMEX_003940 [Taenia solium]|eukprot:TsM_000360100 transcript=TsM_000360100 gene=TsM_000360100